MTMNLPELRQDETPEESQRMYSVFVQMEYRVPAVDGADAIHQVSDDLGKGRSYKYAIEETMSISTRPIPNGAHT